MKTRSQFMPFPLQTNRILLFLALLFSILSAQNDTNEKLAVLPFQTIGIEDEYVQTAESILRMEIETNSTVHLIPTQEIAEKLENKECLDLDCYIETGKKLNASHVLDCKLAALGNKIIVQFVLVDVSAGKELVKDGATSLTIEDLEMVMKRVALSAITKKKIKEKVLVNNIMASEAKKKIRRASNRNFGLSLGYLYPVQGYDNGERVFTFDLRYGYELDNYAVGMLLGIRKGFAVNVYGSYLLSKTDFCPYVGGAFGFHWISHDYYEDDYYYDDQGNYHYSEQKEKREDGFEFTARAGIRAFRTYNFQLMINFEYVVTFNDFNDQAFLFTIGLL